MEEPQKKEENKINEVFFQNIFGEFGFGFYGDILTSDFLNLSGRIENYVYFNLITMKDDLEKLSR